MKKLFAKNAVVEDAVYHEVIPTGVNTDARSHARLGWWIVILGVGGFLLWASIAPLDQGVPVSGTVVVSTNRKAIQHPTGGVVSEILVKDGDTVKAGQVLVRMNDVQAKAQDEVSRVQYNADLATEARLVAERDGKSSITFPPELLRQKGNPRVADDIKTQTQLFESRTKAIHEELAILSEQLDGMRDLAKDGYVARNKLLDLERTYIERKQGYESEVRTQLAEVEKEADALKMRLEALDYDLANAVVKSPVDGTVEGLSVFTSGGVVGPGFKMMDVIPSGDKLIVEAKIPVNLIDKVHPGLKVDFIFTAFNDKRTPHVPGEVDMVSADRMVDEKTGTPYYRMTAYVTPEGMKLLKNLKIRPGMPVQLFVKTGERTMMNYLMRPLLDRMKVSLTEE